MPGWTMWNRRPIFVRRSRNTPVISGENANSRPYTLLPAHRMGAKRHPSTHSPKRYRAIAHSARSSGLRP